MFKEYSWFSVFLFAVVIIVSVFLTIGYFVVYYKCMYIAVSDLPGYCLSFL